MKTLFAMKIDGIDIQWLEEEELLRSAGMHNNSPRARNCFHNTLQVVYEGEGIEVGICVHCGTPKIIDENYENSLVQRIYRLKD